MNISGFMGCILVGIIAFILYLILFRDEFLWVLSKIPDFLKNFFMAISKAYRMAVEGVLINCSPVNPLKVKNKKTRDCRRNYLLNKMKEEEDLIDEDKAKEIELENVIKEDGKNENFISNRYNQRREMFKEDVEKKKKERNIFYVNPKNNNPLESVGYSNRDEAEEACKILEMELATKEQLVDAFNTDDTTNWCNFGWLKDNNSEICLPLQTRVYDRLTNVQRESGMCGSHQGAGVNCIRPIKGEKYGAVCIGKNMNEIDNKMLMEYEIK